MSDSVHVRLKHPHGIAFNISNGRSVVLPGSDFILRGQEKGKLLCGFSECTVSSSDWDEVLAVYPAMVKDFVRKGTLIYKDTAESANANARDNVEVKHGLEPIDPKNDKTLKTQEVPASEAA